MTINSASADQISLIIDLMHEYDESKLIDIEVINNGFFYNTVLTKVKEVFWDTKKKKIQKRNKKFLSKEM